MPAIGLGTDKLLDAERHPQVFYDAVKTIGYRLLDCAAIYTNEALVGQAIQRLVSEQSNAAEGGDSVGRSDLFVITKLWMDSFADPEAALRASMAKL